MHHGVTLNLRCDDPELADYVARIAPEPPSALWNTPDVEVVAHWTTERAKAPLGVLATAYLAALGKRMLLGEGELVWFRMQRDRDLQLRFRAGNRFDVAYCWAPSAKKLAQHPDLKRRKFFDLTRYLVTYPTAWVLERRHGWALLHAAAVALDDTAVLIAGVGGSGKTTAALALAARCGGTLLSDNLVFCDGTAMRPVREPLRLTDDSLELLRDAVADLELLDLPDGDGKTLFRLPGCSRAEYPVRAVFIPRFAAEASVTALAPGVACEVLAATNELALEVNDYHWYRSALDLLWPAPGNARRQLEVFERLGAGAPTYALAIDRERGIAALVDDVGKALGSR
jgi:hypothetical protein